MNGMTARRVITALAVIAALSAGLYLLLRQPPFASGDDGPAAPMQRADRAELFTQLAAHLNQHPRDARAWAIFARLNFSRDRFSEAAAAYARALELPGRVAQDPLVWCEYADALAMAQGGRLDGKPRELIGRALALGPRHPRALEMAGSAEIERGDYAGALRYWVTLLEVLPPGSEQHNELTVAVERVRARARR